MNTGNSMEIIRQRLFIEHDSKDQRRIVIEYTVRSKIDKLKNILLNYDKYLPHLLIQDEKNAILPLMSSRDVKILYSYHIESTENQDEKIQLTKELDDIENNKRHLIWISLKNNPLTKNGPCRNHQILTQL